MSEVITDKLTGRATAGDVTITSENGSATFQMQYGLVKGFVDLLTDASINGDSHNISSTVDNDTGDYTANFTNSFQTNSVPVSNTANTGTICFSRIRTSSNGYMRTAATTTTAAIDRNTMMVACGELA